MRKTSFYIFIIIIIFFHSCRERKRMGAFQGMWYKYGYDTEAFVVRGDSMYFPGLVRGYPYELRKDTLEIQFSERTTRSLILSFSSQRLSIWDKDLTKDTIVLVRKPNYALDTLSD